MTDKPAAKTGRRGPTQRSRSTRTLAVVLLLLAACSKGVTGPRAEGSPSRAVVVVSGLASISPFTTPEGACTVGLTAGSSDSALRDHLAGKGHRVYTAPAMAGHGRVTDQTGFGGFAGCPDALPENMTIDTTGSIDLAGEHLARFLHYLHTAQAVDEFDLVGHSMGGLYARAAIRALSGSDSPLTVHSLTTIGTPWQGSYLSDYANGSVPLSDCLGDQFCESQMKGFVRDITQVYVSGSAREVGQAYLMGPRGWNQVQAGALEDIPVTLIGGDRFNKPGKTNVWPNDGIVALRSALAGDIDDAVLPHRRCYAFDDTHSDYVSKIAELGGPNRQGCPTR